MFQSWHKNCSLICTSKSWSYTQPLFDAHQFYYEAVTSTGIVIWVLVSLYTSNIGHMQPVFDARSFTVSFYFHCYGDVPCYGDLGLPSHSDWVVSTGLMLTLFSVTCRFCVWVSCALVWSNMTLMKHKCFYIWMSTVSVLAFRSTHFEWP